MSTKSFRVTPDELSGVARQLTSLADQLHGATSAVTSVDTSGLAHAELTEALQGFLSGWGWGVRTLHDELMNLATLMTTAAANYGQLDEGLAALAGDSGPAAVASPGTRVAPQLTL